MKKKLTTLLWFSVALFFDSHLYSIEDINEMYTKDVDEKEFVEYAEKNWNQKTSKEFKFFDTKFIGDAQKVEDLLVSETYAFKKDAFITADNFKLECLTRTVENPLFTFIVSAGFLPGKMTGMATLVPMLHKNCNIIFYNNRGKGNSQGALLSSFLWSSLRNYGIKEQYDVIGALNHAQNIDRNKTTPIFMYGICAGALNSIKALCALHQQKKLSQYNIVGLILDSAITSVQRDLENIPDYTCVRGTFCGFVKRILLWSLRYTIFSRCCMAPETATTVDPALLAATKIPTFHINCKTGDPLTTYTCTDEFYKKHKEHVDDENNCTNICFPESKHALHHIKHKVMYAYNLIAHIKKCLPKH